LAILPVSGKFNAYPANVSAFLHNDSVRGFVDDRNEKIGKKIRDAEMGKTPFMLIVGEKEFENDQVSVRQRGKGDLGTMSIPNFIELVNKLVEEELITL